MELLHVNTLNCSSCKPLCVTATVDDSCVLIVSDHCSIDIRLTTTNEVLCQAIYSFISCVAAIDVTWTSQYSCVVTNN